MRLTTKIFIGFLFFIFSLILIFFLYARFLAPTYTGFDPVLENELEAIKLPHTRYVEIKSIEDKNQSGKIFYRLNGTITLKQDSLNSNKMMVNKDLTPYIKTEIKGDTLVIDIDDKIFRDKDKKFDRNFYHLSNVQIHLPVDSSLHLLSHANNVGIEAKNLIMKELNISIDDGEISLKNNTIGKLSTKNKKNRHQKLIFEKNTIGTYNLDLQNVSRWNFTFQNNSIDSLNVYGAKNGDEYTIPHQDIKNLSWYPRKESKLLNIQLGDSVAISFMK